MIPLPLGLLGWWKEILIALLVLALGVQTYRLQGAQGQRDLLALEKKERQNRDAQRELHNLKNKERTDEEYSAARKRAASVVVRANTKGIRGPEKIELAAGGDESPWCFSRRGLTEAITGWLRRDEQRLGRVLQGVLERSSGVAQEGEAVSAAYRACRAYTLGLQ